jgi:hypothetical protein
MATQTHFSTPCMTTADASQVHDPHTLYSHHHGWLRAWLQRRLGCRDEAADLAQDTFLQVLLRPQALHGLRAYRTARQDLGGHGRAPRRPCHRLAPCARLRPDGRAPCHCGCARHAPVGPGLAGARKPHPVSLQVAPHAVRAAGSGRGLGRVVPGRGGRVVDAGLFHRAVAVVPASGGVAQVAGVWLVARWKGAQF